MKQSPLVDNLSEMYSHKLSPKINIVTNENENQETELVNLETE